MAKQNRTVVKPSLLRAELSPEDELVLIRFLRVQSVTGNTERMREECRAFARELRSSATVVTQRHDGNLYITKGVAETYPCYVAHLDTVHRIVPDDEYNIYYYEDDPERDLWGANPKDMTARGIGGDDKVGIFIAMMMLRDLPVCKVALFRDEETGGIGARAADMTFFDNCEFAIEADRRGNDDIVRSAGGTQLYSDEFSEAITPALKKWGYSTAYGALTDVKVLKEKGLPISCLNMSCGYYLPHGPDEYVRPGDVARALELVREMTAACAGRRWLHEYTKPEPYVYNRGYSSSYHAYRAPDPLWVDYCPHCHMRMQDYSSWCAICKKTIPYKNKLRVRAKDKAIATLEQAAKWNEDKKKQPEVITLFDDKTKTWVDYYLDATEETAEHVQQSLMPYVEDGDEWSHWDNQIEEAVKLRQEYLQSNDDGSADEWYAEYNMVGDEICPRCRRDNTEFDTDTGLHWCWRCSDYFVVKEEETMTVAEFLREQGIDLEKDGIDVVD